MTDESFKYTLHHADGNKEIKIGGLKDLYLFINDRIDLEVHKINKRIDGVNTIFYSLLWLPIGSFMLSVIALIKTMG